MLQLAQAQASQHNVTFDTLCIGSVDGNFDYSVDHDKVSSFRFLKSKNIFEYHFDRGGPCFTMTSGINLSNDKSHFSFSFLYNCLQKMTHGVFFINILFALFMPISFCQKITKPKHNKRKTA